jgi:hypothetical protein
MRPFAAAEGACVTSATACGNQSSAAMLGPDDDICGAGRNSNDCQFDVCACGAANTIDGFTTMALPRTSLKPTSTARRRRRRRRQPIRRVARTGIVRGGNVGGGNVGGGNVGGGNVGGGTVGGGTVGSNNDICSLR